MKGPTLESITRHRYTTLPAQINSSKDVKATADRFHARQAQQNGMQPPHETAEKWGNKEPVQDSSRARPPQTAGRKGECRQVA